MLNSTFSSVVSKNVQVFFSRKSHSGDYLWEKYLETRTRDWTFSEIFKLCGHSLFNDVRDFLLRLLCEFISKKKNPKATLSRPAPTGASMHPELLFVRTWELPSLCRLTLYLCAQYTERGAKWLLRQPEMVRLMAKIGDVRAGRVWGKEQESVRKKDAASVLQMGPSSKTRFTSPSEKNKLPLWDANKYWLLRSRRWENAAPSTDEIYTPKNPRGFYSFFKNLIFFPEMARDIDFLIHFAKMRYNHKWKEPGRCPEICDWSNSRFSRSLTF